MLNDKVKSSGYKITYLANKLDLSRAGFRNKLNGDTEFYASEIQKLSELLNLSVREREDIFFNK